ncbi:MAG TPA: DNA repair protein RadA [Rhabdochlamydiaceae bacterium]|nr:DNA repair protein RadA [Rhabdochlamydiaceae bacterium]
MAKTKTIWTCQECGTRQSKWTGSCSACQKWNTFIEEVEIEQRHIEIRSLAPQQPVRLKDVKQDDTQRLSTGLPQCDRLMGGGLVNGSLNLLAGDPGIGKSTLMLHIANNLASQGLVVLYICGEESVEQTALRARRLNITSENLLFYSETNFEQIQTHIERLKPQVLVIDSVQILYKSEIPSAPGSVTQVRELATAFMHLAKKLNICTFMIGHVTKSGEIAGPRVLEHIVDTVLEFEGDRQHGYRILRAVKNRFGPTDDIVLFLMHQEGLKEIENPSETFLQERVKGTAGSVIVPTIEGTRPLLIEIQALVTTSAFATSTRRSIGLDHNRLALLLAVLEKRMGYTLHRNDVFVAVTGGLKIVEPAIDLPILLSIASSFCNKTIDSETVIMGEVGLGGEVRSIPRVEQRLKEASNMGFKRCVLPKRNLKGISVKDFELIGVERVEDAIDKLIN